MKIKIDGLEDLPLEDKYAITISLIRTAYRYWFKELLTKYQVPLRGQIYACFSWKNYRNSEEKQNAAIYTILEHISISALAEEYLKEYTITAFFRLHSEILSGNHIIRVQV